MTREQHIDKAVRIINVALKAIEEAAADAATMRDHLPKYSSCYTMQELDRVQKDCDKAALKCSALSALYHDMNENRESVKVLDFAALYLWYPKIRTAAVRHMTAHTKRTGETLDFFALYAWIYDRIPADYWQGASGIRAAYKNAFISLTVKKGA